MRFSVVTPVHDPPESVLVDMVRSVTGQRFADWELVLVDDGSTRATADLLDRLADDDARIRVHHRDANGGIVAASNDAVDLATGEFLVFVDHDDVVHPNALAHVDAALRERPDADLCYTDEDLVLEDPRAYRWPFHKPDWSPERLRSHNYLTHLTVARASTVRAVGGFRDGFDGSQDHDLVLRIAEVARDVVHVPAVLYHWRVSEGSVAGGGTAKSYAYEAGRRAVQDHCDRIGWEAEVTHGAHPGIYRIDRTVPGDPLISVVIPTRGSTGRVWGIERTFVVDAVASVRSHTSRRIEFVIVADADTPDAVLAATERAADGATVRVIGYDRPFHFSEKVNLGAVHAAGELLLVLNDDVEVITEEFLDPMIPYALDADVGAVGAKMYFADGRIQHAGHVYNHNPRHAMFGHPHDAPGVGHLLHVVRECAGVTAACLLTRAEVFCEVGGFSPMFPSSFNDVDLCLKLATAGYRRIWTPYTELYHFESATRSLAGIDRATINEDAILRRRWRRQLVRDPYYNPNLAPDRDDWVELGLR